ncbi:MULTISPECIES: nucleotidyltransferase family protein [Megamonas]|jgi:predicted nucleotidyltransferase|uniref:nucleotidyltransferase family protein n=1 Tax=Megamonas TaxID=158846 RepID=UPI000E40A1FD|nr:MULTISPECIES: nucleotidyltransferase domain-containing protein [Megamonas]RGO06033.1 nucleotidyltransferase domain-containing protein [Megamonas rupellensis]DAE57370.1 MAG TPA: putative nucleotidyltransferase [Bacteriophage sp.]
MLTIEKIKEIITPICKKYGVKRAYLFGSYARNEATEKSDVDIRIESGKIRGLFQLSGFRLDLVEALGTEVDLLSVLPDPQFKRFRENLKRDEILLYES